MPESDRVVRTKHGWLLSIGRIPSVFRRFFFASQRRAPTGEDGGRRETVVRTAPPDTVTVIPTPSEYIRAGERLMKQKWDEQHDD